MRKKWAIILSATLILLVCFALWETMVSNVEKPKYQILSSQGKIEMREYEPMIIAAVQVQGERAKAIRQGFRRLADYIFGNNTVSTGIVMTAPVTQQHSQKIPMMAPVSEQASDGKWTVSFVMPAKYSMDTLPKPNNSAVVLREIPKKRFVVIQFSGFNSTKNITLHEKKLTAYRLKNAIQGIAPPVYAFYNPPWTLPFLRRNEIMIEIK